MLSKWVGEAERQLRLLFDEAKRLQPSIIFFDEIDGLAPVRSAKQDQIHASIVSTLLALMDGLDSRGQVVVIGATNRIDALDPALRRPGRFDRELLFDLPTLDGRQQILDVHTRDWKPPLSFEFKKSLAAKCVGYCGADIKSLCAEASLAALRRCYPQIYKSSQRLRISTDEITVCDADFDLAFDAIVPSARRSARGGIVAEPLPPHLEPLLSHNMDILVHQFHLPGNYCIVGTEKEHGISYILSALLHKYEHAKVHNCAYSRLLTDNLARTPEESLARRFLGGGIVVIPHFREMWEGGKDLLCRLVDEDGKSKRTSLVCTANSIEDLDVADRIVMEEQFGFKTFLRLREPSEDSKVRFVRSLEKELDIKWKKQAQVKEHAPLQIDDPVPIPVQRAPKPPPSAATLKKEEHYLRELRVALRACMNEIFKERKYKPFAAPVDPEEVPDYYDIIKKPMCLEDICENIDGGAYLCVEDFKADVDLIVAIKRSTIHAIGAIIAERTWRMSPRA